jgi:TonB family protein
MPTMAIPSKLTVSFVLCCVSALSQTSPSTIAQAVSSSRVPATNQSPPSPKPEEYTIEPIEIPRAIYPVAAKEQKIQGQIVGNILVSESGEVESIRISEGDPVLATAAEDAARKWKFKPTLKDGKPLALVARATFNFVLSDDVAETKDVAADLDQISSFPRRIRVSSGVSQGLLLSKLDPIYPEQARAERIQGAVILHAIIGKDGKIADLQVTSGPEALVAAAMQAVRQWQYRPYLNLGQTIRGRYAH